MHRLHLFLTYVRLLLPYNAAVSSMGATALVLLGAAGLFGDTIGEPDWGREARTAAMVAGVLMMTLGHWIAVLIAGLVHRGEQTLYRGGGWSMPGLWFSGWLASAAIGAAIAAMVR